MAGTVLRPQTMAHPDGDIEWWEQMGETPVRERISRDAVEVRITYGVEWSRRVDWLKVVLGAPTTPGGPWVRPWQYPDLPNVWAADCQGEGRGTAKVAGKGAYEYALYEITYTNIDFPEDEDAPLYAFSKSTSASLITLPFSSATWDTSGKRVNVELGVPVAEQEIQLTRYRQGSMTDVDAKLFPFMWKVNNATWYGYPAGTVLFESYGWSQTASVLGEVQSEATCRLKWRAIPWNSGIDQSTSMVDGYTMAASTPYKLFASANFGDLIT